MKTSLILNDFFLKIVGQNGIETIRERHREKEKTTSGSSNLKRSRNAEINRKTERRPSFMNVKFKFLPIFLKTFRTTRQHDNSQTQRTPTCKNSHKLSAPLDLNVQITQTQNLYLKIEQTQQT